MNLQFIPATEEDADELMAVQNAAFADDVRKYGECPSYIEQRETMLEKINSAVFYKILADGKIAGGIEVYKRTETHYHLYMLCVDPALQNNGIGSQALQFLFEHHPEALIWTLVTPADDPRNRHLYEKAGFVNTGERVVSDSLTLIRYERNGIDSGGQVNLCC